MTSSANELLVSVVMPAYNVAWCIGRAVDSVLAQDCRGRELIVVNDGSTDGTRALLGTYGGAITVIEQENRGMSAARNAGIRNSHGTYIAFLDADDWWLPEKLSRQVELMQSRPEIGFCSTAARVEDGDGRLLNLWRCPNGSTDILTTLFAQNAAIAGGCSAVMVRKALFDRVGLFDESLRGFEDPDLWMRLAAVSGYACIDETLAVILRREKSVSRNLDTMRVAALRSMRRNRALLPPPLRGRFWRNCLAGVYTDYAKPAYRAGRLGLAYADTLRALDALSPGPRPAVPRAPAGLPAEKARVSVPLLDTLVLTALVHGAGVALLVGGISAAALIVKSIFDFTRTGPEMAEEVLAHYRLYLAYSLARLFAFAFLITAFMAYLGILVYVVSLVLLDAGYHSGAAVAAAFVAVLLLTARRFARTLLFSPGVIAASSLYSMTHFYPLWDLLTPRRLRALDAALLAVGTLWLAVGLATLARNGAWLAFAALTCIAALYVAICWWATRVSEPAAAPAPKRTPSAPNIVLIGSDTLRADRLFGAGYRRELTPNLARLAKQGTQFTDCYVPCARTAPSLVSMLSGTWPHRHGVRDTFVTPEQTRLRVPSLPQILKQAGYQSGIVGDWAASDAEKFDFGFDFRDLPRDQWNIKYLLRQGPKDMRLFLSLFTQNAFGKLFLPEIYYLGGIPLTEEVGCDTRRMIGRLARDEAPFFLVSFMATTHPPFTSKYPYYSLYSDPEYRGESKFIMAKLRDPWEIIRAQAEPKSKFDLEQVIDLYDGCVRNFDDEVARILAYLDASKLTENTIVVVFSDHGFEFFEHETWGQGNSAIGDFSARVPIIIADPRIRGARRVTQVVRTVDIAPTLLDLAGLPTVDSMQGVSLAPLMRGEVLETELPAFNETGVWLTDLPGTPANHLRYPHLPELLEIPDKRIGMISLKPKYVDIIIAAKDRMVRVGDWKLTYQPLTDGAIYRLFNMRDDPGCLRNVLEQYPRTAGELKSLLDRWMDDDPKSGRLNLAGTVVSARSQEPDRVAIFPAVSGNLP